MNNKNKIIYQDEYKTIFQINSPKHGKFECIIDTEDINKIKNKIWSLKTKKRKAGTIIIGVKAHNGYKKSPTDLHIFITNYKFTDHMDGNVLNNRKNNLRESDYKTNNKNVKLHKDAKIKYKGVDEPVPDKYRARITVDYKTIELGTFKTPELAAEEYNQAAIKYHKDFARLNVIRE